MSHLNSGFLSAYNSLADKHLAGYFNNTRMRRHLQRAGLITRSGDIVPEKELRRKLIRRDHKRRISACLSQGIFHKVLDIERQRRIEIKRKLEDFARKEHVHKLKVQRSKRHSEGIVPLMSPKPPSGPRNKHARHSGTEGEQSESSLSPGSSQPNSAPGRRQRPVRLQPLYSNSISASTQRASHFCSNDTEPYRYSMLKRETRRHGTMPEFFSGISPYRLPVSNNYVMPIPPPANKNERSSKGTTNGRTRGRSLRSTTVPDGPAFTKQDSRFHKTSVHSNVSVTMTFYGKAVHLTPDTMDRKDEVSVFQQHSGGENVCVYRGKLAEGEAFQFVSRRHLGFPFSLTFFLNGMPVERLSSCCEFRHRKGSRLGGKHGQFGFTVVDGASPCYKCIIALGLEKKPTPPPRRLHRDAETADIAGSSSLQMASGEARTEEAVERTQSRQSSQGHAKHHALGIKTQEAHPEENEQEAQDGYDEDFEEEDERVDEDAKEERACALVNGVSSCPSQEGGNPHSDTKEDEVEDHRAREDYEEGRYSDELNKSASVGLESISRFSSSRKDDPDSEAEEVKEAIKDNVDPYPRADYTIELGRNGQSVQDPKTGQSGDTTAPVHRDKPKEEEYLAMEAAGEVKDKPNAYSHPTSMIELDSETQEVYGGVASKASLKKSDSCMPSEEIEATKSSGAKPEKDTGETQRGVETPAVAENINAEEKAARSDGAVNISAVDPTPQEGELRTQEMGEEQEADQWTEEAFPDIEVEEEALGDMFLQSQEPVEKGEESEGGAQNRSTGTDSQTDPSETVKVGAGAGEGNRTDQMAEDGGTLTEGSGLTVQVLEEGKMKEHASERGQKEGTESTASIEAAAFIFDIQDVNAEDTGEDEETEALLDAIMAEIRAQNPTERAEISKEETEAERETTDSVNGEAEIMDGGKDSAEGENKEEAEIAAETPKDEVEEEDGGEAQTGTGDSESKTEMWDDTNKEKLGQVMGGEANEKTEQLVNTGVIDDKEEVVETMIPGTAVNEASTGESKPRAGEEDNRNLSDPKTELWQATCDKIANMPEDSEAADIRVEESENISLGTNAIEKENTEGESSVGEKDEGLEGESKAADLIKESEEMSAKEEEPVRDTETEANGLETEIKEAELEVRYAEMGSSGEKVEDTSVGKVPRSEIDEEPTIDQELGGESSVGEKDEGLEGEIKAADLIKESEEMSAKEEEPVRYTETEANGLETEIKEAELEVRYAEMGSSGEKIEDTSVGKVPRSEIDEEPTVDQKLGGESRPRETNMTPATTQQVETQPEETLDMTEGTLLDVGYAGRGMKNGDTADQREGEEEAVESSRADATVGTPGKVETGRMAQVDRTDEHDLLNTETGGLEVERGEAPGKVETGRMAVDRTDEHDLSNTETGGPEVERGEASVASEKNAKTETEVLGDGINVVMGDADVKEEEQKVRGGIGPERPEENEVNIDTKGLSDESPSQSKLQENTRVVKSDVTGSGLQLKSEDESGHQASRLEEIEEGNKETPKADAADVTECNVEGSESKSEDFWFYTDHRDPHGQCEGSFNSTEISGQGGENAIGEGTSLSHKPGGAAIEVESSTAKSTADGVKDRPEEERRKTGEDEDATAERKERRNAVALESTWNREKSRVDSEHSVSRSKTELGTRATFPPPLMRRSGSYALTIAREGLSLQKFPVSDRELESPLAYAQAAAAIAGNAFTASNQKLQSIATKDT